VLPRMIVTTAGAGGPRGRRGAGRSDTRGYDVEGSASEIDPRAGGTDIP
jgi:hypothetical protein